MNESRKALTAEAILGAQDLKREWVDVPAWGGGVFVQSMPGLALDRWEQRQLERRGKDGTFNMDNVRAELIALTACDEAGQALFTLQQVEALSQKSGAALNRLAVVAMRLNGLHRKDVEELAKN